jgi:large subunit ribosomal protein L13
MKTYTTKLGDIDRQWQVIDASGKTLGRLATDVATILLGKNKTTYSPSLSVGDYVIDLLSPFELSRRPCKCKI